MLDCSARPCCYATAPLQNGMAWVGAALCMHLAQTSVNMIMEQLILQDVTDCAGGQQFMV